MYHFNEGYTVFNLIFFWEVLQVNIKTTNKTRIINQTILHTLSVIVYFGVTSPLVIPCGLKLPCFWPFSSEITVKKKMGDN